MNDDQLARLLHRADAALPPAACPGGMAVRARTIARRQQVVRRSSGAVVLALVMSIGAYLIATGPSREPESPTATAPEMDAEAELAQLRAELTDLRAQIAVATGIIQSLQAGQSTRLAQSRDVTSPLEPTPAERLATEFDKTAFIMVYRGDQMHRTHGLVEPAIESYRRAIELFPDSRWADVARQRIEAIDHPKGDQL